MNPSWISAHLFYYANPNPMLTQCVQPLIAELRERDRKSVV